MKEKHRPPLPRRPGIGYTLNMEILGWALGVLLVAAGLVGVVVPGLPGTPLVFGGLLLAAWADGFRHAGTGTILVLAAMTAASLLIDVLAAGWGVKRAGAGRAAVVGAMLGMIVGLFFGLPGILIGPFAGALVGEFIAHRDPARAGRAGVAAWMGFVVALGVKAGLVFAMIGVFAAAFIG